MGIEMGETRCNSCKMKDILLIAPTSTISGNHSTLNRIREHLLSFGCKTVKLMSMEEGLAALKAGEKYCIVVVIHAYKCRNVVEHLVSTETKLVLIFGGTDLNEDFLDPGKLADMKTVVKRADKCVAFSQAMYEKAVSLWPSCEHKTKLIHQGISTNPSTDFNFRKYLHSRVGLQSQYIALLVAGVRPIKDVLFLVEYFASAAGLDDVTLVILGPILDLEYWKQVEDVLKRLPDSKVAYAGDLSLPEAQAAIQQSDFLVNSSISEGMSGAILEAFHLGTPVLARDNPGNCYIVEHLDNGMIYKTPQEFITHLKTVIGDDLLRDRLIKQAIMMANERFSYDKERILYEQVIESL